MRFLTDLQTAGLLATIVWGVWYWGPVLLDAIFDPHRDRFTDVDHLADADTCGDGRTSGLPEVSQPHGRIGRPH